MSHSRDTTEEDDDPRSPAAGAKLTSRPGALALIVEAGKPCARVAFDLSAVDAVTFGRSPEGRAVTVSDHAGERRLVCLLKDRRLSTVHAQLRRIGGSWSIEDVGSKNGTRINGVEIERASLRTGDLVEIGRSFMVFRDQVSSPVETALSLGLVTQNFGLGRTFMRLMDIGRSAIPVLVHGETGTGKELVARAIHELSTRRGPLRAVNCGALPRTLLESELFGYRKGAFSGATEDRPGLLRSADKGTLFLDEIGDLPIDAQAVLLRVLQEREVLPIGAVNPVPIDVRVIAATHRDLEAMVARERFRADLLARLSGFTVRLPRLQERLEDFGTLLHALIEKAAPTRVSTIELSPAVVHALYAYPWPANIRELEKVITAALVLAPRHVIELEHLSESLSQRPAALSPGSARTADRRAELEALLSEHRGNVSVVATIMKTSRMHIHRLCRRYGIDLAAWRDRS